MSSKSGITKQTRTACKIFISELEERNETTTTPRYLANGPAPWRMKNLLKVQKYMDRIASATTVGGVYQEIGKLLDELEWIVEEDPFLYISSEELINYVMTIPIEQSVLAPIDYLTALQTVKGPELDTGPEYIGNSKTYCIPNRQTMIKLSAWLESEENSEIWTSLERLVDIWGEMLETAWKNYHMVQQQRYDGVMPLGRTGKDPRLLELAIMLENERAATGVETDVRAVVDTLLEMNNTLMIDYSPGKVERMHIRLEKRLKDVLKFVRELQPPQTVQLTVDNVDEFLKRSDDHL